MYWHLCVTVDVQSGELVCLDDLIDVNEDFVLYRKNNYDMTVEEESLYQNYFYLEEGTLCFKDDISDSGWDDAVIVRIKIDDIEDYLKVAKWCYIYNNSVYYFHHFTTF